MKDNKNSVEDLSFNIESELNSAFGSFFDFASDGFGDLEELGKNVAASIANEILQAQLIEPLAKTSNSLISEGINLLLSSNGNVISGGEHVTAYAKGGIVDSPTMFPMANGAGLMGEAGAEAIMPLTRIGGDLGVKATSGNTYVTVQNETNQAVDLSVIESMTNNDGDRFETWLLTAVERNPDVRSALRNI